MDNQKTHIHHGIKFLFITVVLLITCTNAFSHSESIADPNIQKTITVRHIDPNIAAKVVEQIIKLKIFQLPKETLIVPNRQGKMLTAMTKTAGQMKLIEEIVENIDFQVTNEGVINKINIPVANLIFDEFYRIISPLLSKEGRLSYNITAHILVVTEITENLKNIENFAIKLDSYDFVDPNSIPDTAVINTPEQTDANSTETKAADSNEPMVAVQFSGFKIEHITERLKQWTGKEVVPSQEANSLGVTIFAAEKMKRSEAIALLFMAIRQQGYIVEETDDKIYIKTPPFKPDTVQLIEPNEPLENIQDKEIEVRKIFKLKYEKPSTIGQLISSYLSPSGYFTADENTKTLMISDTVKNLIQIEQMIGIFDSDPNSLPKGGVITPAIPDDPNENAQSQETESIQVKNINPDKTIEKLNEILTLMGIDPNNRISLISTDKQNLIFIAGNKEDRQLVKNLIADIDYQVANDSFNFELFTIKFNDFNGFFELMQNIVVVTAVNSSFPIYFHIYPVTQSKQILAFGHNMTRDRFREIISNLEGAIQESPQNKLQRKTFRLMYAKPEDVKNKLEELFGVSISYDQSNKTTSDDPLIAVTFPSLKQIVVLAPEDKMKEIEKLIMEWDSPIDF